jgi:hypothetical protein
MAGPAARDLLQRGNDALARGDWTAAQECFEVVIETDASAEAYEALSWACWWLNDVTCLFRARDRAFRLFIQERAASRRRTPRLSCRSFASNPKEA